MYVNNKRGWCGVRQSRLKLMPLRYLLGDHINFDVLDGLLELSKRGPHALVAELMTFVVAQPLLLLSSSLLHQHEKNKNKVRSCLNFRRCSEPTIHRQRRRRWRRGKGPSHKSEKYGQVYTLRLCEAGLRARGSRHDTTRHDTTVRHASD